MCGIAGWVDSGGIDPAAMDRALEALNRRGPDGSGAWTNSQRTVILGHRRLAILDPSVRGEEPSVAPDRRSAFIHNGEVYNFRELRRDLESRGESFVSESDGEVVHRLLRLEGAAGLERVEGMFALAMWNEPSRTLLLARDRIGIKPLYYASWPGGFAFASEPKAILRLPGISARLDPDSLADFLAYGYVPFDRSLFAGIRKLPPAHRLVYDAASGRADVAPFWKLERADVRDDPDELRERLDRAVVSHLVSDVPVGAFLSGGLDSSTVVSLAARELSRLARRTVKVALTGDGGDEIFGGYGWHETVMRYEAMRERIGFLDPVLSAAHRGIVEPLSGIPAASRAAGSARLLAGEFADRYFPVRGFFTAAEQRRVLGRAPEDHAWLFRKFDRPDLPLAQRLLYLDIHTYLPDNNLMLVDRSTMAVGLEARVPLLDRQLVEYAFSLPPERIVRPGATKIAFREAIAPWLPEPVMTRSKSGFSPPFKRWVGGEARRSAFRTLEAGDLAADGVIDPRGVRTLVESGTQRRHNKLWLLLNLEAWYRRWIRGRSSREAGGAGAPAAVSA